MGVEHVVEVLVVGGEERRRRGGLTGVVVDEGGHEHHGIAGLGVELVESGRDVEVAAAAAAGSIAHEHGCERVCGWWHRAAGLEERRLGQAWAEEVHVVVVVLLLLQEVQWVRGVEERMLVVVVQ